MSDPVELLVLVALLVTLDLAVLRWGHDSRRERDAARNERREWW